MANLRAALDAAIYAKLNTTTVTAVATGGVHNMMAPPNVTPPYIIFQAMSKIDEHSFNGRFGNAIYLVKAISRSNWPKEAEDVDTQIDTALEDASLTITGYSHLLCRRESDFYLPEISDGIIWQHIGGLYRIIADQT